MSGIQVAKGLMQYAGIAPESQQCQACLYGVAASQAFAGRYHCSKGGFFVAAVAGCKEWTRQLDVRPEDV